MGDKNKIAVISSVYKEIANNEDELTVWLKEYKDAIYLSDQDIYSANTLAEVMNVYGKYSPKGVLSDVDLEKIRKKADPFLIAYALLHNCIVVTKEKAAKGPKQGKNRKIPDVCSDLGVECIDDHEMMKRLKFSTSWKGDK